MNSSSNSPQSGRRDKDQQSSVDRWIDEAVAAEQSQPTVDSDLFLARLRRQIAPLVVPARPRLVRSFALAAMVPLALVLWLLFQPVSPEGNTDDLRVDVALIDDLDLLELLNDLSPQVLEQIDPELFDLYLDLELIEELPVEVLGNS